ncbi:hypothetical protein [Microbacterium oleivorans]|uniref:hypothetical protein n=1 Tax=Microbacterium oleivorans TaxID=273677 RepID=UPI001F283C04|nr:hypothetical protein [Microbacterium oleivorans]
MIATVEVRRGFATTTLGRLSRGTHAYTATFVPKDPKVAEGSVSNRASVRVLF